MPKTRHRLSFYACVTLPCSTRYTLSKLLHERPETSWVMATTMQGRASRFSMICPLVSGSRLAVISSAMMRSYRRSASRAMPMRWRCPPERFLPFSLMRVSRPSGRVLTQSVRPAIPMAWES